MTTAIPAGPGARDDKSGTDTPDTDPGKRNYYTITGGIIALILGYWMLSLVNAEATNIAAMLAPPMIIIGYIVIAIGIVL